jgi:3',5'-cyclic AMP phosphodiesterase CpdA
MIRVAHLTDLHLLALDGVPVWRFLNKRLTGWANLRLHRKTIHRPHLVEAIIEALNADPPDHVIVTGDLTNLALETEFDLAARVLGALRVPRENVSIVPGNHDTYTRGAHRSRRFARKFASYLTSDIELSALDFPTVRLRDGVAVVGLSSAVPRLPFVAAGRLGEEQLEALRQLLADERVRQRFLLLFLHHPPVYPASAWKTRMQGLEDAPALAEALAPVARGLVAHGHLHRRVQRSLGRLPVLGATSSSLDSPDPERVAGWNVYEIEDGVLARAYARVWDADRQEFPERAIPRG